MTHTEPPSPPASPASRNPEQLQSDINIIKGVLTETDKSRDTHRIIIAAGNLVCAVFILIVVPIIFLAMGIVGVATPDTPPGEPSPTMIVGGAGLIVTVVVSIVALPFLLAGWGLLKKKSWGNAFAVIAGVFNIMNFPLGTALAIYTFWALANGKLATVD